MQVSSVQMILMHDPGIHNTLLQKQCRSHTLCPKHGKNQRWPHSSQVNPLPLRRISLPPITAVSSPISSTFASFSLWFIALKALAIIREQTGRNSFALSSRLTSNLPLAAQRNFNWCTNLVLALATRKQTTRNSFILSSEWPFLQYFPATQQHFNEEVPDFCNTVPCLSLSAVLWTSSII